MQSVAIFQWRDFTSRRLRLYGWALVDRGSEIHPSGFCLNGAEGSGAATASDEFQVRGREIYWLRRRTPGGVFTTAPLEKALGVPFTIRGANTVRRWSAKYA